MSTEPNSGGDGILADQGSQDFGSMIGGTVTISAATSAATTQAPGGDVGQQQQQQTQDGQTAQTTQTSAATTQQPAQTQAPTQPDLASIIRSTVDATANALQSRQTQQQQTQQPQELSAEEFNRRYGIIQVNEEMMTHILGQDPKRATATLNQIMMGNTMAAVKMANDVIEAKLAQARAQIDPEIKSWRDYQTKQASEALENRFYTAYPALATEKELVAETRDAMIGRGMKFPDEASLFSAVANATNTILARVRGSGGQTQTGQGQQKQQVQTAPRQMSAASSAGRTGTGQATAPKSDVEEVFGADAR